MEVRIEVSDDYFMLSTSIGMWISIFLIGDVVELMATS